MCGLAGFWTAVGGASDELAATVRAMAGTIVCRGPDGSGIWVQDDAGLALGFRRLSIIDLSLAGHQPMVSAGERYVIAFNGEVYNFRDIRRELEPYDHPFRGHSDTEVVLAAIERWGLDAAVRRFVGMFAFALWDCKERRLFLVRDRLGIKPMYYGWAGDTFLFGSELKCLRAHPDFRAELDKEALVLYLRHGYIPSPHTAYRGISKLPPGCVIEITSPAAEPATPIPYWSAAHIIAGGVANPLQSTDMACIEELDAMLRNAVRLRMEADVPLGALLSGGIDSSTVVALMQAQSDRPIRTFSIGFEEAGFNEAHYAREVARHLQTEHTELYVTPEEAQRVIPSLPDIYDEPFADSSQIPTYLLSKLTRQHVTVALSGDGGDELFGGYERYFRMSDYWRKSRSVPRSVRPLAGKACRTLGMTEMVRPCGFWRRSRNLLRLGGELLGISREESAYEHMFSIERNPLFFLNDGDHPSYVMNDPSRWIELPTFFERAMYIDTVSYLPDDILVKVDRASMAVSLEARVPLLDHRVLEYAWRLPLSVKTRNGDGKWILRQVLARYLPHELFTRPKMGFGVPVSDWLRGPLRDWADSLMQGGGLEEGGFRPQRVRARWEAHLSGCVDWSFFLWEVLMFQAWRARWRM